MLSDGADTASLVTLDDVLGLARQKSVSVYTVALQSPAVAGLAARASLSESEDAMKLLARETGAQSFSPAPAQLKSVYGSIATELANQYSIGYIPANTSADGRFRRVVVQVVTKPDLRPRTRLGYTAQDAAAVAVTHSSGGGGTR